MIPDLNETDLNCRFLCGVVEGFYGRPWTGEQRRRLFKWMKNMGMNTYLYAPKDDSKHRMYWRDLYSVEEADALTLLIEAARENGVSFVYAISPGLDITYSSSKDVQLLKKKLQQVMDFGCNAFALLFDDIEVEMCEADKEIFQSFAQAQVSVTNEVYQHLNEPAKFLFCPTEYCASRAVPNVSSSEYLNTIGSKLLPGVDIMWTGPKVISKYISIQSVEELTAVLKRPPVLWDNIHANDYDNKRLFLGPYDGRSTDLIPHLKGVLTNPNCEFEANFVAFHTLSQWYKSNSDGVKRESLLCDSTLTADIRLETESDYGSDEESHLFLQSSYKPRMALKAAISDWMEEIHSQSEVRRRKAPLLPPQVTSAPTPGVNTCMAPTMTTTTTQSLPVPVPTTATITNINELVSSEISDSYLQPIASQNPVNSLVDSGTDTDEDSHSELLEPMDCMVTPGTTPASTTDSIPAVHPSSQAELCDESSDCKSCVSNCDSMQIDSVLPSTSSIMSSAPPEVETCDTAIGQLQTPVNERCLLTQEDMTLLVDLFYLPFEHGGTGVTLLSEFHWLKKTCYVVTDLKCHGNEQLVLQATEWRERAQRFREIVSKIGKLTERLCNSPNQGLVYDVFPYLWDIWGTASLLGSVVEWLGAAPMYKQAFASGDHEPWVFRGGLQGELQRMLPLDTAADLLHTIVPPVPTSKMLRIRPYITQDESVLFDICRKTYYDGRDASKDFPNYPDLVGDRVIGALVTLSPEYCFVIEGEQGVCGYVCSSLDAIQLDKHMKFPWLQQMRSKYPKPGTDSRDDACTLTSAEKELVLSFYEEETFFAEAVCNHHPSIVSIALLNSCFEDQQCPRHALAVAIAALKFNGSRGLYTPVKSSHKYVLEFHAKLGFFEISLPAALSNDTLLMGRVM